MLKLDFQPVSDEPFHATIEPVMAGLRMARSRLSPGFTVRDHELIRDADNSFALVIAKSRRIEVRKHREFSLGRGDGAVMRIDDPGLLGAQESFSYLAMIIPHADLVERENAATDLVIQRIPRRCEPLQLIRAYIRALQKGRVLQADKMTETVRGHLLDLVALTVSGVDLVGESDLGAIGAARLSTALDYIATHFSDPGLTAAVVAHSQNVSSRYLNRLFEGAGIRFNHYLQEQRLSEAHRLLNDAGSAGMAISEIAFGCGFPTYRTSIGCSGNASATRRAACAHGLRLAEPSALTWQATPPRRGRSRPARSGVRYSRAPSA